MTDSGEEFNLTQMREREREMYDLGVYFVRGSCLTMKWRWWQCQTDSRGSGGGGGGGGGGVSYLVLLGVHPGADVVLQVSLCLGRQRHWGVTGRCVRLTLAAVPAQDTEHTYHNNNKNHNNNHNHNNIKYKIIINTIITILIDTFISIFSHTQLWSLLPISAIVHSTILNVQIITLLITFTVHKYFYPYVIIWMIIVKLQVNGP